MVATQLSLDLPPPKPTFRHGGARSGAGRPPKKGTTKHVARPSLRKDRPVHVTLRAQRVLPSLRQQVPHAVIRAALDAARKKDDARFQVVHYSIQQDHVHLIVEATNKTTLSRGMQGLVIRIARNLNRELSRSGKVWDERYHRHDLKTPTEVRNALRYVLSNFRKHSRVIGAAFTDPWSSASTFDGFDPEIALVRVSAETEPWRRVRAWTWLLRTGWKKNGPLSPVEAPRARLGGRGVSL